MQGIRGVLDFWFSDDARPHWFAPSAEFDRAVRERFGELVARALSGELGIWETSAEGALALCLLLDQMPRNIYRGEARAYAGDARALALAERALAEGWDQELPGERKQFVYMPFMHSESLANQLRALALFEAAALPECRRYAEEHLEVIRRFGRFPHRNAVLGRPSTADEEAYLQEHASGWQATPGGPEPRPDDEP